MTKRDKILSIISGVALTATITTAGVAASGFLTPQQQAEIDISSAVSDGLAKISDATKSGVEEIMSTAGDTKINTGSAEVQESQPAGVAPETTSPVSPITTSPESGAPAEITFREFDLSGKTISANGIEIRFGKAEVYYKEGRVRFHLSVMNGSFTYYYFYGIEGFIATDSNGNHVGLGNNASVAVRQGEGEVKQAFLTLYQPGADLTRVTLTYDFAQHGGTSSMTPNPQTITFDFPKE